MQQDLLLCKAHGAQRERDGHQQIKPLRNHADHGADRGGNRFGKGKMVDGERFDEQRQADRDDRDARDLDNQLDAADDLRRLFLHLLRLRGQPGGIGVLAHVGQAGQTLAVDHEGAGFQLVPRGLFNLVRFAGQK